MQSHLHDDLRKERNSKRGIMTDLMERFTDKESAKDNTKRFKDDECEDIFGEPFMESQEEMLGEYVEATSSIADIQSQI